MILMNSDMKLALRRCSVALSCIEGKVTSLTKRALLPNHTWVHWPMCRKANRLTLGCGEGKCSIYFRCETKRIGGSCSEDPNYPMAFGEGALMAVWGRGCRVYDQLMHSSWIGWHQGEVSSIINLLVSIRIGPMCLWSALFIWWVCFL